MSTCNLKTGARSQGSALAATSHEDSQRASIGYRLSALFVLLALFLTLSGCTNPATPAATPVVTIAASMPPAEGPIVADATVRPAQLSDLRFEIGGTIAEVLVKEGDMVSAGAALARLNQVDLQLGVEQARAALGEAKAAYAQLEAGATEEQIAAAKARLDQANAQLAQTRGAVTASDIAAAKAALRQEQEQLAKLRRGANPEPIAAARAQVDQAQANLNTQRDQLSAVKTNAELAMQQATEQLTKAQSAYATALSDWNYVQDTGANPSNPNTTGPDGTKVTNKVNDSQRQQYYNAYVQAEASLRSAEYAVQQAKVSYDTARQNEVTGIAAAEAKLNEAQANLNKILASADRDQIAAAEAQVAQAQARLDKLLGTERAGQIAAADAAARAAQANLEQTMAATRPVDLDVALARISSAEVNLRQAEHSLEKATLRAPFAGMIGEVNLHLGEAVSSAGPAAIVLADSSAWKIETDNLTERDVVRFAVGSPATISFDALPELELQGVVSAIKPLGADSFGDINYTVTIMPKQWDKRLRWEMSATVTIRL